MDLWADKHEQLTQEQDAFKKEMIKNSAAIKTAPSAAEKTRLEEYQDRLAQQVTRIKKGFEDSDFEKRDRQFRLAALRDINNPGTHDFLKLSTGLESSFEKTLQKPAKAPKLSPKGRWAVAGVVGAIAIGGIATAAGIYGSKKAAQSEN